MGEICRQALRPSRDITTFSTLMDREGDC
ncbi:hypothetical protein XAP6164_2940006 [Xanthomonas phaseoli pv. phaseoli]|nr:hypothetical protein XAP6164_2940006 [Xanthomonas phaseoli pv. phaseoli]